ncbi:MAG: hypothetical protein QXT33_06430 [Thermofilum sp.]
MIRKDKLFNALLPGLYSVSVAALAALGERRLDAYFSILVLEYAVLHALLRPKRKGRDFILIALIALFTVVVALRIVEVLGL